MESADLSLVETSDGLQVVFDDRALYDDQPVSAATRKALSLPVQPQTLYVLASPLAWHGVAGFLSRLPADSAILAVEADPVLLELARRLRTDDLPPDRVILSAADPAPIREALGASVPGTTAQAVLGRFRRVREITFSRGALINRSRYREIAQALEQDVRIIWQNRLTLSAMGRLWVGNVIRNLPGLADGAKLPTLRGPVVVCGAGPSLTASVSLLREERSALTICAVDTALPCLVQNDITPDFVIAIEGQIANLYDFLPVGRRDYTLVADLSSAPSVIRLHDPHRVVWVNSRFAEIRLLDRLQEAGLPLLAIPPLGSVGVAAVDIALRLTRGPVLLTGLDFAFRSDTHARGAPAHLSQLISNQRLHTAPPPSLAGRWLERPGVDGQPIMTTLSMIGYAEQLSALLRADTAPMADGGPGPTRPIVSVEPFGLEAGARPVSVEEARKLIVGEGRQPGGAPAKPKHAPGVQTGGHLHQIRTLLVEELELLDRLRKLVETELAEKTSSADSSTTDSTDGDALARAFELCDYVAVDFPDLPSFREPDGELQTDRGFLIRVRVAIDFYRDRLDRSLKYLRF